MNTGLMQYRLIIHTGTVPSSAKPARVAVKRHCLLERGVLQGSVFGHLVFGLYTRPIGDAEVAVWMARNELKLNAQKSRAVIFHSSEGGVTNSRKLLLK